MQRQRVNGEPVALNGSRPSAEPAVGAGAESAAPVQRAADEPPPAGDAGAPAAPVPPAAEPETPTEEKADAAASTDVNALFKQLYPRVRDELRWELRVQRERAGLLSDPL